MRPSLPAIMIGRAIRRYNPETPATFRLVLPDGSTEQNRAGKPDVTIRFRHWSSLWRCLILGSYGFVSDFIKRKIDIEGDLRWLAYLSYKSSITSHLREEIKREIRADPFLVYLLDRLHMLLHLAWTRKQARYNAEYHYGLHPEFYFNYLGSTGAYSTGFWYEHTKDVDEAQRIKWEFILNKLHLTEPNLRICSVGTGFGYGEIIAAEKYGATVDCFNTCRPQNAWLRQEVKRRGLEGKVNVYDMDYRDVGKKFHKVYDRFLAIECVEHAQDLFRKSTIRSWAGCLKDDGVGVIQWLSYDIDSDVPHWIRSYVYPGVTMPPLGQLLDELALAGCEVQDVLCNRRHYHYTLNAWTDNFIKNWEKIHAIDPAFYDESFRRKWLLYLSSGTSYLVVSDATARLYQMTFTKGDTYTYPMNRDFLYRAGANDAAWVGPHPWVKTTSNPASYAIAR